MTQRRWRVAEFSHGSVAAEVPVEVRTAVLPKADGDRRRIGLWPRVKVELTVRIDRGGKIDQFVAKGDAAADRGRQQRDFWIRGEHADDSMKAHELVDESQQGELSSLGGAGVVVSVDRHRRKHGRPVSLEIGHCPGIP